MHTPIVGRRRIRAARRSLLVFALAGLLLVLLAAPASAHSVSGPRATNFHSRLVSVTPPAPGVDFRVLDLNSKVQLTNHTDSEVVVLGYEGEPYLRVGPNGVYENRRSAATYINRTRKGGVVPPGVDTRATAPPDWKKISDGNSASWHDHRAHWMGGGLPPQVAAAPGSFHHISDGQITFRHDGTASVAKVALDWVPGPSSLPWIPVIAVCFALGFAVAFIPRWSRWLAVLLGLLVVIDAAHAIAYEMGRPGGTGTRVVQFFGGTFVSIVVWIVAIPTMIGLWRRRVEALYGAIFVGLMVALVGGATDLSSLSRSQLPPAGPDFLTRLEIAVALGLGAGVALGALVRLVMSERARRAERESRTSRSGWVSSLVVGLDERELRRIAAELDVDEVLAAAFRDLAVRLRDDAGAFAAGALVFDVAADDETGRHSWSIAARDGGLAEVRGPVEPTVTRIGVTFPRLLQLLAGTVTLDASVDEGHATYTGDAGFVALVARHLAERDDARPTGRSQPTGRAPAS